jgi:hypothetical protein
LTTSSAEAAPPTSKPVVIQQVGDGIEVSLLQSLGEEYSDQRLAIARLSVTDDQKQLAEKTTDEAVEKLSEQLKSVRAGSSWTPEQRAELKRVTGDVQMRVVAAIGTSGAAELKRRLKEPTFTGLHFARAVRGNARWLSLTDEQRTAMEKVLAETQAKFDALPQEVPVDQGLLDEFRHRIKIVQTEATQKLMALLDDRQRAIVDPKSPVLLPRDDIDLPMPGPQPPAGAK